MVVGIDRQGQPLSMVIEERRRCLTASAQYLVSHILTHEI